MKAVDIPVKFPIPFANDAGGSYTRPIPEASQIGIQNGAASLTDGFPPLNFTPRSAGGIPPFGEDFNGLLKQITAWSRWQNAGATVSYDSGFSTSIGGYPKGAVLESATVPGLSWRSTADDNGTNPDDPATSANWSLNGPIMLGANTPFYVSATGSDVTGNGLSTGTAWASLQHALDYLVANYCLSGYIATINVGAGTSFTRGIMQGAVAGQNGPQSLVINGAGGGSTTIAGVAANGPGSQFTISNLKLATGGSIQGIQTNSGGTVSIGAGVVFGACGGAHMEADRAGSILRNSDYSISGNSTFHMLGSFAGNFAASGITVTTTTPITYSQAFIQLQGCATSSEDTMTYTGSPTTGKIYNITLNGVLTTGGNLAILPGSIAGTTATGGQAV